MKLKAPNVDNGPKHIAYNIHSEKIYRNFKFSLTKRNRGISYLANIGLGLHITLNQMVFDFN